MSESQCDVQPVVGAETGGRCGDGRRTQSGRIQQRLVLAGQLLDGRSVGRGFAAAGKGSDHFGTGEGRERFVFYFLFYANKWKTRRGFIRFMQFKENPSIGFVLLVSELARVVPGMFVHITELVDQTLPGSVHRSGQRGEQKRSNAIARLPHRSILFGDLALQQLNVVHRFHPPIERRQRRVRLQNVPRVIVPDELRFVGDALNAVQAPFDLSLDGLNAEKRA